MTVRDSVACLGLMVTSATIAACGGSAAATQVGGDAGVCDGQTGVSAARSQNYIVVLVATTQTGPGLATPSASSAASAAPIIVSGTETTVAGPGATHLELHVCNRSTGAVVTGLHPAVTLRNASTGAQPAAFPVAVLQDAGQGVNGTAYGNNVMLQQEQTYTLAVKIGIADEVSLTYEVPATGPRQSPRPGCLQNHQLC